MTTCKNIAAGIVRNCDDKMVVGLQDEAIVINHDDIDFDSSTFEATNPMVISSIVLKTTSPTSTGYKLEGYNFSHEHETSLVRQRFQSGWNHSFLFRIFDNTPDTKEFVQNAEEARFVVIIKNRYHNRNADSDPGSTVFEVLGWKHGLRLSEATRNPQDEETKGAWVLQASNDENNPEPDPPYAFWITDYATTETAFDAFV